MLNTITRQHAFLFLDTEFTNFKDRKPLSVGLVDHNGREFYAELADTPTEEASLFVRERVLPLLGAEGTLIAPRAAVAAQLREWMRAYTGQAVVLVHDFFADREIAFDLLSGLPGAGAQVVRSQRERDHFRGLANELGLAELVPMDVGNQFNEAGFDSWFDSRPEALRSHALHDARALAHSFKRPVLAAAA
ncbi:hypothetical protein [Methylibium petroleiphilum]|uniref:Uncharacterized protein n=1 Tax=Methylibium petroleiphilum (strain ATCC BAA-1232 / LMG 22953 / PM1) TaxID=420662 RepID=A2SMW9_METPP|nr:hypothetical protein [Methylibium petroleiphilum]ABM96908.1 hypothetical protein Mpe_B0129 [Methylibium petroleiphilum PM1]